MSTIYMICRLKKQCVHGLYSLEKAVGLIQLSLGISSQPEYNIAFS